MPSISPLPELLVNNVPTVSDTKRTFYAAHTRPINSIYRRVVEELMVEMHLLSVNTSFAYDPIYALGVVTSFDRFMEGYQPEADRASIFQALCHALRSSEEQYRQDAQRILASVKDATAEQMVSLLTQEPNVPGSEELKQILAALSARSSFKYSRLFAIGLYTLLEASAADLVQDKEKCEATLQKISEALSLPADKFNKDVEFYRDNLDKLRQTREVLAEMVQADRKKREQRQADKAAKAAQPDSTSESTEETSPNPTNEETSSEPPKTPSDA